MRERDLPGDPDEGSGEPNGHGGAADETPARIVVVRSGGVAGLTRTWSVEPGRETDEWLDLVEACPWDEVPEDTVSRDRFIWRIEVTSTGGRHAASVPDAALTGPWRELVARVRSSAG